jgi:hypothetical protein
MIITFAPSYERMMNIGITVVPASRLVGGSRNWSLPASAATGNPWLVLGALPYLPCEQRDMLSASQDVIAITKLFSDSPTFFGRRCFK